MSFIPPPSQLDNELARAREQELEAKAEHYAEQHADGAAVRPGLLRRLLNSLTGKRGRVTPGS